MLDELLKNELSFNRESGTYLFYGDDLEKNYNIALEFSAELFSKNIENEIEKIHSNISTIFTENELITNGKDVQKQCDIVDEHNKKISDVLSKLNNELADKILKQ